MTVAWPVCVVTRFCVRKSFCHLIVIMANRDVKKLNNLFQLDRSFAQLWFSFVYLLYQLLSDRYVQLKGYWVCCELSTCLQLLGAVYNTGYQHLACSSWLWLFECNRQKRCIIITKLQDVSGMDCCYLE